MAKGGTLFLDEIGEIPLKMQVDLLRVLQEKTFHRVGGNREINVDFRLISATHQDLLKKVSREQFRKDFYFRLKVIEIEVPPLRNRKEDIPALAEHFLQRFRRETNKQVKGLREEAMRSCNPTIGPVMSGSWKTRIERAVVLSKSAYLKKEDFAFLFRVLRRKREDRSRCARSKGNHIEHILKLAAGIFPGRRPSWK